jgi:tetratricopeptide (TPR) repeat protein
MGILKRLMGRGKTAQLSVSGGDAPPELAAAVEALQGEDWPQALRLAQPHLEAKSASLRADAYRLCALATSRQGQWRTAFSCWQKLFELEPSAHNALQLASASVMAGEVERGKAWLMKFDEINRVRRESSCAAAYVNFISALTQAGHARETLPYLTWLRELYRQLKITDDMFLHQRGVPFFGVFLENSWPLLRQCLDDGALLAWYRVMLDDLDPDGRAMLSGWLADALPAAAANEEQP